MDEPKIDVKIIETENMKKIMKMYIDNIRDSDTVAFTIHFDKARMDNLFVKSVEILIDSEYPKDEASEDKVP